LEQIVNHSKLVKVLELFLGKDPAIIKMQTITQRHKAEHQGKNFHGRGRNRAKINATDAFL